MNFAMQAIQKYADNNIESLCEVMIILSDFQVEKGCIDSQVKVSDKKKWRVIMCQLIHLEYSPFH